MKDIQQNTLNKNQIKVKIPNNLNNKNKILKLTLITLIVQIPNNKVKCLEKKEFFSQNRINLDLLL